MVWIGAGLKRSLATVRVVIRFQSWRQQVAVLPQLITHDELLVVPIRVGNAAILASHQA